LQEASLSFLDVISCGFGAIVLLLIIARIGEPVDVTDEPLLDVDISAQQQTLLGVRSDIRSFQHSITIGEQQLADLQKRLLLVEKQLASAKTQLEGKKQGTSPEYLELQLAAQVLTEEMERLLGENYQSQNQIIGGIPVDSEYIIFVIDTSGSMFQAAWPKVKSELANILDIYPEVKGLQIMNDQGNYMFPETRNEWISDDEQRRKAITLKLNTWRPFSNSSPVEGIQAAISTFYDPNKKISVYVFGDDFSGRSVRRVVDTVAQLNSSNASGERLVRIHAIGFPVHFRGTPGDSAIRFAALMRELSSQNGGTFVGISSLDE
jgi:hypothetical protein